MTGPLICRPSTTSRPSSATSMLTTSPGAGIPSTRERCGWPMPTICLGHHQRFGYFSKTGLPWKAIFDITCNPKIPSFLEDAAAGTLQSVSWIDPAFTNFNPLGFPVNDDHPHGRHQRRPGPCPGRLRRAGRQPAVGPIAAGHRVRRKRRFLRSRPAAARRRTTSPECSAGTACGCQRSSCRRGSNRAPCRTRSSITLRSSRPSCGAFARKPCSSGSRARGKRARLSLGPQYPGRRVAHASHLGELLTRSTPRPAPPRDVLLQQAAARAAQAETSQPRPGHRDQAGDHPLNDLQKSILAATRELRRRGHPANVP